MNEPCVFEGPTRYLSECILGLVYIGTGGNVARAVCVASTVRASEYARLCLFMAHSVSTFECAYL